MRLIVRHAQHFVERSLAGRQIAQGVSAQRSHAGRARDPAQRLVRCLCPVCRQAQPITDAERALLAGGGGAAAIHDAALPDRLWSAPGCPACRGLGYQERKGIYELMPASDALKQGIHEGAGEQALRRIARSAGMGSLRADALRYLAAGETSLDEVLRVTHD